MNIETKDYNGNCRRGNGRLSLSLRDKIWIGFTLTPVVGGIIWWGAILTADVRGNCEAINTVKETPLQVAVIQGDVEHIKEEQQEIKENVKELRTEQHTMRAEMNQGFKEILRAIK